MASETRQDPERIYLEPAPYSPEGRFWCEDDVWPLDGDGPGGVEYIRADLHATEIARLTRELEAERGISRARGEDLTEALGHLSALVDLYRDGYPEHSDHAASLVSAAEIYLESPSREQEVGAATAEIADRLAALLSAPSGVEEPDESEIPVRCTCEWESPMTGDVDTCWPHVLDPYCRVHGAPGGNPEPCRCVPVEGEPVPARQLESDINTLKSRLDSLYKTRLRRIEELAKWYEENAKNKN